MKRLAFLTVAAMAASAMAAEAPAPAAVPAAAPAVKITGDIDFRLRYHYTVTKNAAGVETGKTGDYSNQYAWNLKITAAPVENLTFGLRLSNPSGYSTDKVTDNMTWVSASKYFALTLPEMYFKWTMDKFALTAGLMQVLGNTTLDLVAFEVSNYKNVGDRPWAVSMNNSLAGFALSYGILKDKETTLGVNLISAIAKDTALGKPSEALERDKLRFIFSVPTSLMAGKLSVTPVFSLRTNTYSSADLKTYNNAYAVGLDLGVKPMDMLGVRLGASAGGFNYKDSLGRSYEPFGYLTNAGLDVKPGFGAVKLDFSYGLSKDWRANPTINKDLLYWDLIYSIPVAKLNIVPRLRIWYFFQANTNGTEDKTSNLQVRPELIFKTSF